MRPRLSDVYRLSEVWLFKILNLAEDFFCGSHKRFFHDHATCTFSEISKTATYMVETAVKLFLFVITKVFNIMFRI